MTYTIEQLRILIDDWDYENRGAGRDPYEVNHFLDWLAKKAADNADCSHPCIEHEGGEYGVCALCHQPVARESAKHG